MGEFEFSLFWVIAVTSVSIWALGVYLVIKGWTEGRQFASFSAPALERTESREITEEPREKPLRKVAGLEEIEISIAEEKTEEKPEEKIEKKPEPLPAKQQIITPRAAPPIKEIKEVLKEESPPFLNIEEFYREFGKANVIEFPAEYVAEDKVRGLDGKESTLAEFAKSCYAQIGFRCKDTVIYGKRQDQLYKVGIFDLVCDHYASDEQGYIDFFGENKEKFSDELASLKSNPEFIHENMKELVRNYKDLPQLIIWDDKELFLVLVKSRAEELTQKEIHWLRDFVLQKKLIKAKIFKIVERKLPEPKTVQRPPLAEPASAFKLRPPSIIEQPPPYAAKTTGLPSIQNAPTMPEIPKPPIAPKQIPADFVKKDAIELAAKPKPEISPPEEKPAKEAKKITKKPFTKEEIDFLQKQRESLSNEELAEKLGRTVDSVTHKLSRLGLSREAFEWTNDKEQYLKENIRGFSYSKLAEKLGTTIPSVRARCKKLGIKK